MEDTGTSGKAVQEGEAKKETSMGHNPEECPVCMSSMTVLDETVQRPRTLPCGHTVCTQCISKLKQHARITCPECRVIHAVPEGGQFPINYALEAFIRRTGDAEAAAAASPPHSAKTGKGVAGAADQKEAAGLSRKMHSFLQEQEASAVAAITACQEVQEQLDQYQTTLRGWGEQQQQLEGRLQGLLDQSRSVTDLVRQEESRAATKKEEAREGERQLHAALEALRTPPTDKEARLAVVEVFRCTNEAEQVLKECRESFPDANTATTVRKVGEASNAALEAFQAAVKAFQEALKNHPSVPGKEPLPQSEADFTIENRLYAILAPSLKAENLRSPTQPVRRLLEAGRMFGVHQMWGRSQHARISLEDGGVYLYSLKQKPLPPDAMVIQMSQLVPPSPPCVVFLDLSWPGSAPRRVHVSLSPDTELGRKMVLLCTGQRDHSYSGKRLGHVENKGKAGEYVRVSGFFSSSRRVFQPSYLDWNEYQKSRWSGAVWCWDASSFGDVVFAITTRIWEHGTDWPWKFGEVVQGFDTVKAAAEHTPITEVTISDCGVVL